MKILEVVQGSPEWHAVRARHKTASEAPVMMAASSKIRRSELVAMKAIGTEREISEWVQKNLFDKGHEAEAASRPFAEELLGVELFPATGVDDNDELLASFDGLTMAEDVAYEHKMWNEELAAAVRAGELTGEYFWQLEQQLLVSGAREVLFVVSDGTAERRVHMTYRAVPGRVKQLCDGWAQFDKDVANYTPDAALPVLDPKVIGALPSLAITLEGSVKSSNLATYRVSALAYIESINTNLESDQDFADAEKDVKFCDAAEKELQLVKSQALGQTRSIDDLFRTVDELSEAMRQKRLMLEKLVDSRKKVIRFEIQQKAQKEFDDCVRTINAALGRVTLPAIKPDFATAMKGKKTLTSLRGAVADELARVKIEATNHSERLAANLKLIDQHPAHGFLFNDLAHIATKQTEDLAVLVKLRVSEHTSAEEKRLADERAKIRAEEAARVAVPAAAPAIANAVVPSDWHGTTPAASADQASGQIAANSDTARAYPEHAELVSDRELFGSRSGASTRSVPAPSLDSILSVLSGHYMVDRATVIGWLRSIELFESVA